MTREPLFDGDGGEVDVDAAWAQIIANWDGPAAGATESDPADAAARHRADPDTPDDGPPIDVRGSASTTEATAQHSGTTSSGTTSTASSTPASSTPAGADPRDAEPPAAATPPGDHDSRGGAGRDAATGRHRQQNPSEERLSGDLSWDRLPLRLPEPDPIIDLPIDRPRRRPEPEAGPSPSRSDPSRSDLGRSDVGRSEPRGSGSGPRDVSADGPSFLDGLDGVGESDRYEPPEPPPLPRPDLLTALAWLGAIGSPVLLLLAALFWRTAPALLIGVAVVAFIAGFVTLVVRLPDRDEDDTDDGARV